MARKKMDNAPTMSQRTNEWRKKTSVAYTIKLNKSTQSDVIERLAQVDNKTSYIVELIREDIDKSGNHTQKVITLSELSTTMLDGEKARLEFGNGTIWHANKQDIANDTRIVREYHRESDGLLVVKVKAR